MNSYMGLLVNSFNERVVEETMCRDTINIGWNGHLYDCDFNQALELNIGALNVKSTSDSGSEKGCSVVDEILGSEYESTPKTIWDIESFSIFEKQRIQHASHCYGCTAGAGSS